MVSVACKVDVEGSWFLTWRLRKCVVVSFEVRVVLTSLSCSPKRLDFSTPKLVALAQTFPKVLHGYVKGNHEIYQHRCLEDTPTNEKHA